MTPTTSFVSLIPGLAYMLDIASGREDVGAGVNGDGHGGKRQDWSGSQSRTNVILNYHDSGSFESFYCVLYWNSKKVLHSSFVF